MLLPIFRDSVVDLDPDLHHFGHLDPHPDPHQIIFRIRIEIYKLDPEPEPHQFILQMSSQSVWNVSLF
jgi:hypothetical protein